LEFGRTKANLKPQISDMHLDFLGFLHSRTNTIKFIEKDTPHWLINELLKAACAGQTPDINNNLNYLVITKEQAKSDIAHLFANKDIITSPATLIVICERYQTTRDVLQPLVIASTQNMLLAAEALELGSFWHTDILSSADGNEFMNRIGADKNMIPLTAVSVGYKLKAEDYNCSLIKDNIVWS
jgi:hypothetical protein